MKSVGERLAYTRNTILSMNQKDFSKLLCISQGALSEIENNKRGLPMEAIIELMKYSKKDIRISCTWILTGIEDTTSAPALSNDEKELLTLWVADKVLDAVEDEEELKWDAIKVAQSSISL